MSELAGILVGKSAQVAEGPHDVGVGELEEKSVRMEDTIFVADELDRDEMSDLAIGDGLTAEVLGETANGGEQKCRGVLLGGVQVGR